MDTLRKIYNVNNDGKKLRLNSSNKGDAVNSTIRLIGNEMQEIEKQGKKYYVVPAVILGEDVIQGMGYFGPELIGRRLITQSFEQWNDIPAVIYHPIEDAKTIEVIEAELVGRLYNAQLLNGDKQVSYFDDFDMKLPMRIKVEVHLEEELLLKHEKGKDIIERLKKGEVIELSTGYYLTYYATQYGKYNDKEFVGIQLECIPNHLAILPDMIGAYSVPQGGGLGRENSKEIIKNNEPPKETSDKPQGATMNKYVDKLKALGFSETVANAMTDAEAERVINMSEKHNSDAMEAEVTKRVNTFKDGYADSEEGKAKINECADKLVEERENKNFYDEAWEKLNGKVEGLKREDLDSMSKNAVNVLLNTQDSIEPPIGNPSMIDNNAPEAPDFD